VIWNPSWGSGADPVVVYDSTVPAETVKAVLAERQLKKSAPAARYFSQPGEGVILLGQGFSDEQLSHLWGKPVQWQAHYPEDSPQELRWKANLKRGMEQRVEGRIQLSAERTLRIKYAGLSLDSTVVGEGYSTFALSFPVHTEGRTAVELWVDEKKVKDIRFFARPLEKQRISIVEDFPDLEHRLLAEWLGRRGHEVSVSTPVAKGVVQQASINKSSGTDLIITSSGRVKPGTPVLVLQGKDGAQVNRAAGTAFHLNAGAETVPWAGELQQYKHKAMLKENQFQVGDLPVYVEKQAVKVGLSLFTETFPAKLSGDSVLYDRIWSEILAALSGPDSLLVQGPVVSFQETALPNSKGLGEKNAFFPVDTGWVARAPYGEIYLETEPSVRMSAWLKSNTASGKDAEENRKYLPDLWKFLGVLFSLGLLWLEPKFKY
jgi:hypothetical protein